MEYIAEASAPGLYEVYETSGMGKLVVLEGLDQFDVHSPGALESFMLANYQYVVVVYWFLLAGTIIYMLLRHVILPVFQKIHVHF